MKDLLLSTLDKVYRRRYTPETGLMEPPISRIPVKRIPAVFFATERGNEPVRDWLKSKLSRAERKLVGDDIKTVEVGWPVGMPTCRPLGRRLHEVRTHLENRIARVIFYVDVQERMVLLHGFVKKDQQTPPEDIRLAETRMKQHAEKLR